MFVAYHGKDAMFDEGERFLSLLDECLGQQFELPGAPGVTAAILPRRDALPRSGCYPRMISGAVEQMIVHSVPSDGPPADFTFTDEHREALGDQPALFYSRE